MSRIAKNSIIISNDVICKFENGSFHAKGKLGEMSLKVNDLFNVGSEAYLYSSEVNISGVT